MGIRLTVPSPVDASPMDAYGELIEIHISRRSSECRALFGFWPSRQAMVDGIPPFREIGFVVGGESYQALITAKADVVASFHTVADSMALGGQIPGSTAHNG